MYNNSFVCTADGQGKLALLSIDESLLGTWERGIEICSTIGYVNSVSTNRLTDIVFRNGTSGFILDCENYMPSGVFSSTNCPTLNSIYATDIIGLDASNQDKIRQFYAYATSYNA